MKILFSADWHIKLGQKNVPREWQKNRYKMFFEKIYEIEKNVDIHIIGGDIFDKVPNPEEMDIYFNYISKISIPTFIYDGNHEASKKGQTFLKYFEEATTSVNKNAHIISGIAEIHGIDIIPYTHLRSFDPKNFHNDILCTHVRGEIKPHVVPEIDLEKFNRWKVVLAGDLHSYENTQRNIIYPGSPMAITFHRTKIKNGVIIFDTNTLEHKWIDLELPQLIRKTVSNDNEIIKTNYDHTIYEIVGNAATLSNVDMNSDIIDKKIIKKNNTSKLDLSNKSTEEELNIYLSKVENLADAEIQNILKVYHDYFQET